MSETKKIVVERFPVDRAPEELRLRVPGKAAVRVILEAGPGQGGAEPRRLLDFYGSSKGLCVYQGIDATAFIRQLRVEWN